MWSLREVILVLLMAGALSLAMASKGDGRPGPTPMDGVEGGGVIPPPPPRP